MDIYRAPAPVVSEYSIDDHPHLAGGKMRVVFEYFRKEVLALDPGVTEQFLKLYVAYKAERNFVDVVPQAKALCLSLNIDPHAVSDPRKMVVDVMGVGPWGNGDSKVKLSDPADTPYVITLVRQALEAQLGDALWMREPQAQHLQRIRLTVQLKAAAMFVRSVQGVRSLWFFIVVVLWLDPPLGSGAAGADCLHSHATQL